MNRVFRKIDREKVPLYTIQESDHVEFKPTVADRMKHGFMDAMKNGGLGFCGNVINYLDHFPLQTRGSYVDYYSLLNLSYVLWLYNLGCTKRESMRLFSKLAYWVRQAQKKAVVNERFAVDIGDIPVGATALRYVRDGGKAFERDTVRSLSMLQAVLTALVFSVRAREGGEHTLLNNALYEAAPTLAHMLPRIEVGGKPYSIYKTVYNEGEQMSSTLLFRVVPAVYARLIVEKCVWRAFDRLNGVNGIRTTVFPKEEFITKIMMYMGLYRWTRTLPKRRVSTRTADRSTCGED